MDNTRWISCWISRSTSRSVHCEIHVFFYGDTAVVYISWNYKRSFLGYFKTTNIYRWCSKGVLRCERDGYKRTTSADISSSYNSFPYHANRTGNIIYIATSWKYITSQRPKRTKVIVKRDRVCMDKCCVVRYGVNADTIDRFTWITPYRSIKGFTFFHRLRRGNNTDSSYLCLFKISCNRFITIHNYDFWVCISCDISTPISKWPSQVSNSSQLYRCIWRVCDFIRI